MSSAGILYVVGSFAIFLAERMFSANDMVRWPLLLLGVVKVASIRTLLVFVAAFL